MSRRREVPSFRFRSLGILGFDKIKEKRISPEISSLPSLPYSAFPPPFFPFLVFFSIMAVSFDRKHSAFSPLFFMLSVLLNSESQQYLQFGYFNPLRLFSIPTNSMNYRPEMAFCSLIDLCSFCLPTLHN